MINSQNKTPDYSFQEIAKNKIVSVFEKNLKSKILLVIPTGGGKTTTALKSIYEMYNKGLLFETDRILWVTHRVNLVSQVKEYLDPDPEGKDTEEDLKRKKILKQIFDIRIINNLSKKLESIDVSVYKLFIIDEAHHTGAASYKPLFNKNIGILGLTATPVRTDSEKLQFDSIAYQITYRELLKRRVILEPEFLTISTNSEITLDNSDDLNDVNITNKQYNTPKRNQIIADTIFDTADAHKKIIIFAGSNNHVDDLYKIFDIKNKIEGEQYHIGYIYSENRNGKTNDGGITNDKYLKWHKGLNKPTILINCGILTEGYDDPNIDTVVLTVPTKSELYYMQCVGRVVRRPKNNPEQKTYVLECEDKYVNFVYRIDNAWLFADLSPYLEPLIVPPIPIINNEYFKDELIKILKKHHVNTKYLNTIQTDLDADTTSLLLFKSTIGDNYKTWYPLIITPEKRSIYTEIFNHFSINISALSRINPSYIIFDKFELNENDQYFESRNSAYVNNFHRALILAYEDKINSTKVKRIEYYNFFIENRQKSWFYTFLYNIKIILRKLHHNLLSNYK